MSQDTKMLQYIIHYKAEGWLAISARLLSPHNYVPVIVSEDDFQTTYY